jgi:hypothetical protein
MRFRTVTPGVGPVYEFDWPDSGGGGGTPTAEYHDSGYTIASPLTLSENTQTLVVSFTLDPGTYILTCVASVFMEGSAAAVPGPIMYAKGDIDITTLATVTGPNPFPIGFDQHGNSSGVVANRHVTVNGTGIYQVVATPGLGGVRFSVTASVTSASVSINRYLYTASVTALKIA